MRYTNIKLLIIINVFVHNYTHIILRSQVLSTPVQFVVHIFTKRIFKSAHFKFVSNEMISYKISTFIAKSNAVCHNYLAVYNRYLLKCSLSTLPSLLMLWTAIALCTVTINRSRDSGSPLSLRQTNLSLYRVWLREWSFCKIKMSFLCPFPPKINKRRKMTGNICLELAMVWVEM